MWKAVGYITVSLSFGMFVGMLYSKVLTLQQVKDTVYNFYQGFIKRFDDSVTGNDGHYSSARIIEYMWHIGTFCLICVCVLRKIVIQEGILFLLGGVIGVNNIKSVANKAQEVKDSIKTSMSSKENQGA